MKKLIFISMCLISILSFAQQKKIANKNSIQEFKICGLCKGNGKDPKCKGTGLCQEHDYTKYLDRECYKNCKCEEGDEWEEPETVEACTERCKKNCEKDGFCNNCDSYNGTCKKPWCNNGICRNCNGEGKTKLHK